MTAISPKDPDVPAEHLREVLRMFVPDEIGPAAARALYELSLGVNPVPGLRGDCFDPRWCRYDDQHHYGLALCDDDGIVRKGGMHHGTDYECTGHAHFGGYHIRCTSPAHYTHTTEPLDNGSEVPT